MQYARILEHLLIEQHGAKVPKQYMGVKNFWKHELTDKNQYISGLMQHNEQIVVKFYQK
jgi:hypothetical protein